MKLADGTSTQTTVEEDVVCVQFDDERGVWQVSPGVKKVRRKQVVTISAKGSPALMVFFMDKRLFADRHAIIEEGCREKFKVRTDKAGAYPYVVLVLSDPPVLAEGSAMPVFWVDR